MAIKLVIKCTNINLSTFHLILITNFKNIFITDKILICSQINEYDIRLDYNIYYDLFKTS